MPTCPICASPIEEVVVYTIQKKFRQMLMACETCIKRKREEKK